MNQFLQGFLGNSWLEKIAALISVLAIWMTVKELILCWFFDIVSSILYFFVFYATRLYSDALLQIFFIVLSIYGWVKWTSRQAADTVTSPCPIALAVRPINATEMSISVAFTILGTISGGILAMHFGASFPFADSFLSSLSIVATWLSARKVVENWHLWIFANCLYVLLFLAKKLYPTALLYFILALLAISGLINWRKSEAKLS